MRKKVLSILLMLIILAQMPLNVLALKEGYHAGPRTYELTEEYCVELDKATISDDSISIQSGGKVRYGFYLPFDAESITLVFSGSAVPVSVFDGVESYTITPDDESSEITYNFKSFPRIGEKDYTFTTSTSATISKIVFNKAKLVMTDTYKEFVLPDLSEEEIAIQGAILINTKSAAFLANGSTRYINADNPNETPKNINGSVYLPAHTLARAFGAYYEELPEKNYILLREPISKSELMFDSETAFMEINGDRQQINNISIFENGKAYLPVRLVAETFGKRIDYYNNLIAIDDNKYYVNDELYDSNVRGYIDSILKPFIPNNKIGRTYHVAQTPNASDSNPGTEEAPFRTISKAGAIVSAGDTVIVHEGTYRETVTVKNNGEPTRPIVFKEAEGEEAVISALEVIDGFAELEDGTFVASFPWDLGDGRNQIFYNGKTVPEARYPNGPGIDIGPDVEPLSNNWPVIGDLVTDPENNLRVTSQTLLNQDEANYWKDAYFISLRGYGYTLSTARVKSSKKGELYLSNPSVYYWDKGQHNQWNWGYLVGHRNAMDLPGEWVIDNNILFMIPPEGSDADTLTIEAKRRQLVADLANNKFVQLRGFTTIGGSMKFNESEMCLVDDCTIKYNNHYILSQDQHSGYIDDANGKNANGAPPRGEVGIYVGGKNNVFTNNKFEEAAAAAIYGVGLYTYIENNYIANCGYAGSYVAGLNFNGEGWESLTTPRGGHLIVQNTAFNSGRSPLQTTRPAGAGMMPMIPYEVAYNEFYNGMLASLDTGIVYTYFVDHGNSRIKTRMHNNYVYYTGPETNPYSFGIYHDGGTQNIDTYENMIFTTHEGVRIVHDPVFVQDSTAANAICNIWNNRYIEGVEGGRDGLKPEHYPYGVKPFDAGCRMDRDSYLVNYNSRNLEIENRRDDILIPDAYSEGVKKNPDGSFKITGDGQWVKFTGVDCNEVNGAEIFYKGDKYLIDKADDSISIIVDDVNSGTETKVLNPGLTTTYMEHSQNSVSRELPMLMGTHDVYLKFNGFDLLDIVGLKLEVRERFTGVHQNTVYGGNFNNFFQTEDTDFSPTPKVSNFDEVNPFVNNTWKGITLIYKDVQIDYDTNELVVNYCTDAPYHGQNVQVRLNSMDNEPVAEFETVATGWGTWDKEYRIPLNKTVEKGTYTLYITFDDDDGSKSCNLYCIKFINPNELPAANNAAGNK